MKLTAVSGDLALDFMASSPMSCLAVLAAVVELAFLAMEVKAIGAARAEVASRFGAVCTQLSGRVVFVHGCGWRVGVVGAGYG